MGASPAQADSPVGRDWCRGPMNAIPALLWATALGAGSAHPSVVPTAKPSSCGTSKGVRSDQITGSSVAWWSRWDGVGCGQAAAIPLSSRS